MNKYTEAFERIRTNNYAKHILGVVRKEKDIKMISDLCESQTIGINEHWDFGEQKVSHGTTFMFHSNDSINEPSHPISRDRLKLIESRLDNLEIDKGIKPQKDADGKIRLGNWVFSDTPQGTQIEYIDPDEEKENTTTENSDVYGSSYGPKYHKASYLLNKIKKLLEQDY